jgi:hypothetical protein
MKGMRVAAAAVAMAVMASPTASTTVLDTVRGAFGDFSHAVSTAWPDLGGDQTVHVPVGVPTQATQAPNGAPAGSPDSYSLTQDATWAPCATIPIVVNWDGAPAGAREDLAAAIAAVNDASGLNMTIVGQTSETMRPAGTASAHRDTQGWKPALVTFTAPNGVGPLQPNQAGVAEAAPGHTDRGLRYFSGQVAFNTNHAHMYPAGKAQRALFMHELSHLAGLSHTDDSSQIMAHTIQVTEFGAGDLAGLAKVGGCR